jgi:hypothetical protein
MRKMLCFLDDTFDTKLQVVQSRTTHVGLDGFIIGKACIGLLLRVLGVRRGGGLGGASLVTGSLRVHGM